MLQVAEAPVVLAGSLLNASAVARAAASEARRKGLDIAFVCSGDFLGSKFAVDDAFAAGYLATLLRRESAAGEVSLDESAVAAVRLYRSYCQEAGSSDPEEDPPREAILRAFWESHNAQVLRRVGLAEDVEYCAQMDISIKVPRLRVDDGMMVLL
jgi:2-phosphosulfolactate phosphatase